MKLFKIEIERGKKGQELIVHAEEEEVARAHVMARRAGWTIVQCIEIVGEAHFTVALLDPET